MPVNPSNKRRRAARATANDKLVIDGVTYGVGAKAGLAPRIGKSLHSFYYYIKLTLTVDAKPSNNFRKYCEIILL